MVGGDAGLQAGQERAVAEHGQVAVVEGADVLVDDLADAVALRAGRQAHAGVEARDRAASSQPLRLKMKEMAGSIDASSSRSTTSSRAGV